MPGANRSLRILLNCIGRRVELVQAFRAAAARLGIAVEIWGADHSATAPAMSFVDRAVVVPLVSDPGYIDAMIGLVRKHDISLLIPLLDQDLLPMAVASDEFAAAGCRVVISSARTVATCRDKLLACHHLIGAGIDTPRTWTMSEARSRHRHRFPYFVKPRCGSASTGLHLVENATELALVDRWVADPIIQEHLVGPEFTLDAYTGLDGKPHCVVPRRRIRVRGGEVVESQIAIEPDLIQIGCRVVKSLDRCMGVVTIQLIRRPGGAPAVIEINPRFGGGVPLSIAAGADMPRWLLEEHLGRRPRIPQTVKQNGLMMNRYDQSVFRMPNGRIVAGPRP